LIYLGPALCVFEVFAKYTGPPVFRGRHFSATNYAKLTHKVARPKIVWQTISSVCLILNLRFIVISVSGFVL